MRLQVALNYFTWGITNLNSLSVMLKTKNYFTALVAIVLCVGYGSLKASGTTSDAGKPAAQTAALNHAAAIDAADAATLAAPAEVAAPAKNAPALLKHEAEARRIMANVKTKTDFAKLSRADKKTVRAFVVEKKMSVNKADKTNGGSNQVVSAVLAFFLGGLAIHRVYMGAKWWLIPAYIFTFFGIFGIVPLIDFIIILINGTGSFEDSNKYFAW